MFSMFLTLNERRSFIELLRLLKIYILDSEKVKSVSW